MSSDAILQRPTQVRVHGVSVACHDRSSAIATLVALHDLERPASCFFVNAHSINLSRHSQEYFDAVHRADLVLNDGVGLDLAARINGASFPDNLNGTDLIPQLLAIANQFRWSVYLLGAKPGVADRAAESIGQEFPNIRMCGTEDGYFADREDDVVAAINRTRPDLLLVGMGNPQQEIFIDRMLTEGRLASVRLAIGVGAYLDFAAGRFERAPRVVRALRMEWGWRLVQEPARMWRRYLIGNWSFLFWTLVYRLRQPESVEAHPARPGAKASLVDFTPQPQVIDLTVVPHPQASRPLLEAI
jgi:N-acetylglucosaminyldiphosphoundecaprenol N-acetyl-beta-D-mannosaminyltransferase